MVKWKLKIFNKKMNKPIRTNYPDVCVSTFELDYFQDNRGKNFEIYHPESHGIEFPFILDSCSVSTKGVLRGFHGDSINWKLIQCLQGEIQLYVINPKLGSSREFILNAEKPMQVLIHSGVLNAHLCLSDNCIFYYKWSDGYVPVDKQLHIKWNDPKYNLAWLIKNPILSERDK